MYGDMPPDEVSRLVAQIARALECAHAESVVHRDLKPANIFLARDEDGGALLKLLDFGIARATRTRRMSSPFSTGEGIVFGTPGYMSPEQACGSKLDGHVDLWALATVAYEALAGELPLRGTYTHELLRNLHRGEIVPIHERNAELPDGLAAFFRRAFDPRIEHRFASASELASSFARAIATGGATRQRTAPMPAPRGLRGDTLPMAVESPPASKHSRPLRRAWPRIAGATVALVAIVATRGLRPSARGVAPASSIAVNAVASTRDAPPAFAPAPPSRSPTRLRPRRRSRRHSPNRLAIPPLVVRPGRLPDPLRRSRWRHPLRRRRRSGRRPLIPYRAPSFGRTRKPRAGRQECHALSCDPARPRAVLLSALSETSWSRTRLRDAPCATVDAHLDSRKRRARFSSGTCEPGARSWPRRTPNGNSRARTGSTSSARVVGHRP